MRFLSANVLILSLSFGVIAPGIAYANLCADIYAASAQSVRPLSPATKRMIKQIHESDLGRIFTDTENKKIDWYTFETLKELRSQVSAYSLYLNKLSREDRAAELSAFKKYLESDPELKSIFSQMEAFQKFEYFPGQYEMRKNVIDELISILRLLPQDFRPRIAKIAWDQRRQSLDVETEKLMKDFVKNFDEKLKAAGYPSYAAYEKSVRAIDDPHYQRAISIIDNNQLDIAIRRPEGGRFWIPKVGFHNQFTTKSSQGTFYPEYRNKVEAALTSSDLKNYTAKDNELKPKYGTIYPNQDSGLAVDKRPTNHYGEDIYYFKKTSVEKRLSYTMNDSFISMKYNGIWKSFIPWERRLLMVPFVVANLSQKNDFFPNGKDTKISLPALKMETSTYWETQIFGRLDLDAVESFEFQKNPPEGEFFTELQKRNIKIYDGRDGKPIPWEP